MKSVFTLLLLSASILSHGQKTIEELNLIANEQLKKYCSSNTWQERLTCVLNASETSNYMEEKYTEPFTPNDTSSFIYKVYQDIITKPLVKESKIENYYKKTYSITYKGVNRTSTYPFKLVGENLLIDWQAMQGTSELTTKSFNLRKPKDYVLMRVKMILVDHKYEKELPDYFTIKIEQESESVSEYALIHKENPNSQLLMEELYDAKWHKKVIWIKKFNWASKDLNSYYQILENISLVGFINSIENDSYYVEEIESKQVKITLESQNLVEEKKQYEIKKEKLEQEEKQKQLLKEQKEKERKEKEYFNNLISSQPISLKQLNSSRIEYYGKSIELMGYIELSDYYNYGYNKSEATHYSFKLKDPNGDVIQIYFLKEKCKSLFDRLTKTNKIPVKVKALASKHLQEGSFGNLLMEGISFEELLIGN